MGLDVFYIAPRILPSTLLTLQLIGYLLLITVSAETQNETICTNVGNRETIVLECSGEQQLRVISADFGKLQTYESSTPCSSGNVIGPHDCLVVDGELSEQVRASCNTQSSCRQRTQYEGTPTLCKKGFHGPRFINVFYECVQGSDPSTTIDPNKEKEKIFNGTRVELQSDSYPQMTDEIYGASCKIDLEKNTKVKLDIYDLSAYLDSSSSPFCVSWGEEKTCAQESQGIVYIAPKYITESTTLRFSREHSDFHGKFWIVMLGLSSFDDKTPAKITVTCRDAEHTANSASMTGSASGDIALITLIIIFLLVVFIIVLIYVVLKRRRKQRSPGEKPEPPPKPPKPPPAENKPMLPPPDEPPPPPPLAKEEEIDEESSIGKDDTMEKPSYLKEDEIGNADTIEKPAYLKEPPRE